MFITICAYVSRWRESVRSTETAALLASVPVLVVFVMMMVAFMRTLNEDRLKLESRADKYREVERRSLRITQVREQKEDDNLYLE